MTPNDLYGLRILVVEDEAMVAMLVEDILTDVGCIVVDVAASVEKGLRLANSGGPDIDGAVLDVNIGGTKVFTVADELAGREIPFVFATGYGFAGLENRYADRRTIAKPFQMDTLKRALLDALGEASPAM